MAVANPNLDEARNAYSTFQGDLQSGTINLNAHLDKAYQVEIMRYLRDHGLQGVMKPVRSLELVLRNKATAELLPLGAMGHWFRMMKIRFNRPSRRWIILPDICYTRAS